MKNRIVVDLHTHTIASGHAYGTIRENAKAAGEKGLAALGTSEHAPGVQGTCDPIYFNNIRAIPRNLYGVNIYYGVEDNVLNDGSLALPGFTYRNLDYGIVGIHGTCYQDQGVEKNTDNLIKCMSDPKIFFVSHPDDGYFPLDYERVVLAAKEYGVALEVNNSSVRSRWKKNVIENIHTYLELCMKHRAFISVGSDAHDPSQIGVFDHAIKLLDEFGFDEDLIVNNSEEKFRGFIKFNG
ncbi:MAG: phosphatase [Erysipelotrichaceae bacterium]|nr:phosphatase [Erysipelotrichaceae bacterium]